MRPTPKFHLSKAAAAADAYSSSDGDGSDEDDYRFPSTNHNDDDHSEFRPRKRRRGGGGTSAKERAALGVFASDSEDDGQTARRLKKKTRLRARGVAFVPTGALQSKEEDQDDEDDEEQEDGKWPEKMNTKTQDEDEDEEMGDDDDAGDNSGIGGAFGFSGRGGLGFTKATVEDDDEHEESAGPPPAAPRRFTPFVPSSEAPDIPVLRDDLEDDQPNIVARPSAFSKGKKGKNSNSFAARMMAKMGYVEGTGLGANKQGRNIIVEANLRPAGVGLGAVKEKSQKEREYEKKVARERGEVVVSSDEEERKKKRERRKKKAAGVRLGDGLGDGSGTSTPKRQPRTRFLTAEELKATAPGLHIPEVFAPILDMTGPASKLLMSTSGLMAPITDGFVKSTEQMESAEVTEARNIVRTAQADLFMLTDEWRNLDDRKKWIDLELAERAKEVEQLRAELEGLELAFNSIAEDLQAAANWDQTVACLERTLAIQAPKEEIADIVVSALHPFMRQAEWDPLLEPTRFAVDLQKFAPVLLHTPSADKSLRRADPTAMFAHRHDDEYVARSHRSSTTAYETMIYALWLPSVLAAIRTWEPSDADAMLELFEAWRGLLPGFVHAQVVDAIARRLETAVSEWQPRKKVDSLNNGKRATGPTLPHMWLFPWLQYLPSHHLEPRGTGLVAEVRRKFRHLVDAWDFSHGLIPGLESWKPVFGEEHWRGLVVQSILPAIGRALRDRFRVDPADQEPTFGVLSGVLEWCRVLSPETVGAALVLDVFPAWHARLAEWIAMGPDANLDELAGWFGWWTDDVLPLEVRDLEAVTAEFDRANRKLWALVSDEAIQAAGQAH